ncbi:MAG: penicillin-binding protein 2 [Bacteroidia bacterium]
MKIYEERSKVMIMIVAAVCLIFLARLFYIQVIDQTYKQFAEDNALRKETIYPARGLIYDRKGNILVRNETIFDVMVTPSKVKQLDTNAFCNLLEVDKEEFLKAFFKAKRYSVHKPSPVVRSITSAQYGRFQERLFEFRGFFVQPRTTRTYPLSVASHAIGYLGEVNETEMGERDTSYYRSGDYIGKSGLEKSYEEHLRGRKGVKHVLVDVLNREQGHYQGGKYDVASVAGKDLITGLDLKLQEYGEKLMKGKKGSIIAIEPSTGEILTLISSPSYDPNLLLGRERAKNYAKLILDKDKPMFNRAISAKYPPGSTLKPIQALLALQRKLITPHTTYTCSGGYRLSARHTIGCHSSGTFDVHNSIRLSCNTFYCHTFKALIDDPRINNTAKGLQEWADGLAKFGMGIKLGIDVPNESKGIVPTPKYYDKYHGEGRWKSSAILSLAIGQAEISLTPLQMANSAAVIANRGYYITPHFVRSINTKTGSQPLSYKRFETGIDTSYFGVMVNAMHSVVDHGTATMAKVKNITICGKTGTAQNPHGEDHALFVGFAPKENPKIAICVVVENAGYGGTWAAPIAGLLIEMYLHDSVGRANMEKWILDAAYLHKGEVKEDEKDKKDKKDTKKETTKNNTEAIKQND